jgi:hypothetical protein
MKAARQLDTTDLSAANLPYPLIAAIRDVYEPAGIKVTNAAGCETEGFEYGACRLGLDGYTIVFRVAKTTPTKIGQFVTLWKRPTPAGEIAPLDTNDLVDFVVVAVSNATHCGQFIFNRSVLIAENIFSQAGKGGKRAFRVYPPWTKPVAQQAIKTQQWQAHYFLPLTSDQTTHITKVRQLFFSSLS